MRKVLLAFILVFSLLFVSCNGETDINDNLLPYFTFEKTGEGVASAEIKSGAAISLARVPEVVVLDDEHLTLTQFKGNATTSTDTLKVIYLPDTVSTYSGNRFEGMFNLEKVSVYQTDNPLKKSNWPDIQSCRIDGKPGYDFDAWYSDSEYTVKTTSTDTFSSCPDAYPRWEPRKYQVTFNPNGGAFTTGTDIDQPRQITQVYDSHYVLPDEPRQKGYYFDGWYTASAGGQKVTESNIVKVLDDSTVLYAHWRKKVFKLTLVLNDKEEVLDPSIASQNNGWTEYQGDFETPLPNNTYTTSSSDIQIYLKNDKNLVYKHFAGWYKDKNFSGDPITSISETESGALTLYAKWEKHHYVYNGEVDINEQFLTGEHICSCGKHHTAEKDKWTQHASDDKTHAVADCQIPGCDVSLDEVYKGFVVIDGFTVVYNIPNTEVTSGDVSVSSPTDGKFYLTFTPATTPTNIDLFIGYVYKDGSYTKLNQPDSGKYVLEFIPTSTGKYLYIISIGTKSGNTITREGYINVNDID